MNHAIFIYDDSMAECAGIAASSLRDVAPLTNIMLLRQDSDDPMWRGRVATRRVELLRLVTLNYDQVVPGDNILALDVDLIVKKDPFLMFDENPNADVIVTRRKNKWKHMINGGVWGFRFNLRGSRFIDFHVDQVHTKSWKPYRDYLKKFGHLDEVNWRVGQDFLNVILTNPLPFECKVADAGWRWNFVHDSGSKKKVDPEKQAAQDAIFAKAKEEYAKAMNDPEIGIVHFKARMKKLMSEYYHKWRKA